MLTQSGLQLFLFKNSKLLLRKHTSSVNYLKRSINTYRQKLQSVVR